MSGYSKFLATGERIKAKKAGKLEAVTTPPSTPVILTKSFIEEKVIEKKEANKASDFVAKTLNTKPQVQRIEFNSIVDNRGFTDEFGNAVLPSEVLELIDNKMYLPRHRKLAREHGVKYLQKLTELAHTKAKPSHWYATVTSTANWGQTLDMLQDLFKRIHTALTTLDKVGVTNQWQEQWLNYYIGACRKLSEAQIANCIELATARGVKRPPNMFAKAVSTALSK